ncbi:tyrosine-protein phosphatase, partial [Escherichia coli]
MCYQYRRSITEPFSQNAFKKILETLASQKDGATIFHCSEGKDRTGLTTVFILYLLGVNWETIRQDYLYSNFTLRDYQAAMDKKIIAEG